MDRDQVIRAWGLALATASAFLLRPAAAEKAADSDFRPLFNGRDLSGWVNQGTADGAWHVEDGVLVIEKAHGGWLRTEREFSNFELRVEFRLSPGGNSGVFLRAPIHGDGAYQGMEIQVLDHFHEMYKDIQPGQFSGSIYDVVPASDHDALKPAGEWNAYEILCDGPHVKVTINGKVVVDADLAQHADRLEKHPGIGRRSGFIGLQSHGSRVEYRKVEVKELGGAEDASSATKAPDAE